MVENRQKNPYEWLRRHIILSLVVAGIISLSLVSGAIYYQYRSVVNEKATGRLVAVVYNHQASIEKFLQEITSAMRMVVLLESLDSLRERSELQRVFRLLEVGYDYAFEDLGVIGAEGYHYSYVGPYDLMDKNYLDTPWFKEVMATGVHISDVFLGYREVPHFIIAVRKGEGPSAWILRATVNAVRFGELVEYVRFGRTGHAYIVSKEGYYQTRSRLGQRVLERVDTRTFVLEDFEGVRFEQRSEGARQIFRAKTWMKENEWLLVVEQDVDDVLWELHLLRDKAFFMFVMGLLVLGGMTYVTIRVLVNKVDKVSEEKSQMDQQLIHSQKMASIGQLSAGIAHEINNPLAVIGEEAGWIQDILKREHFKDVKDLDEIEDSLREIATQSARCREITHKLLSFARKMDATLRDVDLNKLLEEVVSMREREAALSNITVKRKFAEDLPVVYSDASQLRQVFLNLFNNAMDAIQRDGVITVETRKRDERTVVVNIRDAGMGIPEENLHKVFDPFFTTKDPGKGTGLGLSICHGIISKLGGKIIVESEVGKGTKFSIRLPLDPGRVQGTA